MKRFYLSLVLMLCLPAIASYAAPTGSVHSWPKRVRHAFSQSPTATSRSAAEPGTAKELWAVLSYDESDDYTMGAGTLPLTDPATFTTVYPIDLDISAGAYADGKLYLQHTSLIYPKKLLAVDLETGIQEEVAAYTNEDPVFYDMTYDSSTSTMYAIGGFMSQGNSVFSVNLQDGSYEKLFDSTADLLTLAADANGNIYGAASDGNLYKVSISGQRMDLIGSTGETPLYMQSMDFDDGDHTLYWAGITAESVSFLATVDVTTGKATRLMSPITEYNANLVALHASSEAAAGRPAPVGNLAVKAGAEGVLEATLTWTNPSETAEGNPLESLTDIRIYRDGDLIRTIENPAVGEKASYTDTPEMHGFATYMLIASNENGQSQSVSSDPVLVGQDVPSHVENLQISRDGDKLTVSWNAPSSSVNGGYVDYAALKYDVVRLPDNTAIATDLVATSCADNTIAELNAYSYSVVPKSAGGKGEAAETGKLFSGPSLTLPYACDFSTEEQRNLWIFEDANEDGCPWLFGSNYRDNWMEYNITQYESEPETAADDWAFSAPIELQAGKNYSLGFLAKYNLGLGAKEKFKVALCSSADSESVVQVIKDYNDPNVEDNQNFREMHESFSVEKDGSYHLAFHCYSEPHQWSVSITDITLSEVIDTDMTCESVKGLTKPVQNAPTAYEVDIRNTGLLPVSACEVEVVDSKGNVLGSNKVNRTLDSQEQLIVEVRCTLSEPGSDKLYGRVICENDKNPDGDVSPELAIEILPSGDLEWTYVGSKAEMVYSWDAPFASSFPFNRSQTIYLADEMGLPCNSIEKLAYYYYIDPTFGVAAQDIALRVSVANTKEESLAAGYVPDSEFTKVFEGNVSLDPDNNVMLIEFDKPFISNGQNLCIMTERDESSREVYAGNYFLCTTLDDESAVRTRFFISEKNPFDPNIEEENISRANYPNISVLTNRANASNPEIGDSRISVYPNPAEGLVTVRCAEGIERVDVFGIATGAAVRSVAGSGETSLTVDLTGLAAGVYFVRINDAHTVKLIKR